MTMLIKRQFPWLILLGTLLGVFPASVFSVAGGPHWLEVHVFSKQTGDAVRDAAVCLGTTARPDQFGARRSDARGVVRFEDLRRLPLLVTVSKRGFQGRKQLLEPLYQNRVLVLKLASGGGGPECVAPIESAGVDTASGLSIDSVTITADPASGGANKVLVSVSVSGPANQIRISEQPDFAGASWQEFQTAVPYTIGPGKGLRHIYVQVRRFAQLQGASIEVVSATEKADYRLR